MASLLDLADARLRGLLDIPTRAARAVVNPMLFSGLLGGKTLPKEQGFAEAAFGLPAQTDMSVLDPNQAAYMQGYSAGEPIAYLGMASPFAAPAAVAGAKAVAPKAGMALENYMMRQGMMPSVIDVNNLPNKGKDFIQDSAENLVTQLKKLGFDATVDHSGSKAGASSYVTISDPITGRYLKDPIRFSGHSKGAYQSQFVNEINDPVEDIPKVIEQALAMRQLGESELMKKNRLTDEAYKILIKKDLKPKQIYKKINESSVEELQKIIDGKK